MTRTLRLGTAVLVAAPLTAAAVSATSTPAAAAGCTSNVYTVTRHAGVYGYEDGNGALQGLLKYKDAGDRVVGPRANRTVPHSFVDLGSGTNPHTGGTVALMADSALSYRYCY